MGWRPTQVVVFKREVTDACEYFIYWYYFK